MHKTALQLKAEDHLQMYVFSYACITFLLLWQVTLIYINDLHNVA